MMALQGRPVLGLFTELLHMHVTCASHTRGPNVCVTFCCCDVSHEFKLIFFRAKSRGIGLNKTIYMSHKAMCQGDKSPNVTGP